ncbi:MULTISPECIES: hypothetical protein [Gilliamella]|uniref:hypothetical protein n=1 Tax=Gilliamella TaxID=1193503 RepID=UPI000A14E8D1|nr:MULTISPECIES: hypothetical protein [Gilliamella]MCX8665666.1 hypothetical protein [Gilliamella sp. B2887]MCX8698576.1 hypothetical protein [Gilliamella sp. B3000]
MLSKKAYLAFQAFLVSVFTPLLDNLCALHEWTIGYKTYSPAVSVFIAYYIVVFSSRYSFKSLEKCRYEHAQTEYLEKINKQLGMDISDEKRVELEELRDDILSKELDIYQLQLNACQNDFKKSLED